MEPQQQKESKELEGPARPGPRRPRRYRVRVRGDLPENLALRIAELHAAALAMASAGPPPASTKFETGDGVEHDTGTQEHV